MNHSENRKIRLGWLIAALLIVPTSASAQINQPPIYNHHEDCLYSAALGVCGNDCLCSPTAQSVGWPCTGCTTPTGKWPAFSMLFYGDCIGVNFDELALVDLPQNALEVGVQTLLPSYNISLTPLARLDRIRELPLECTPTRAPVAASARYTIGLAGSPAGADLDCSGAVFLITAEYNSTLFEVTLHGRIRSGSTFSCGSTVLDPFAPRLIVGTEVITTNSLRFPDLVANPEYVKVAIKPGRSSREAGNQSVTLRVHSFNWFGDTDQFNLCLVAGNCPEGYRFQQDSAANVQVFSLELPPDWCQDPPPLDSEDLLRLSTLGDEQRRAAEFDGIGAKLLNGLTAELPNLRCGSGRFRAGRTLEESLGNDAFWHETYSCNDFVRINLYGAWCAVSAPTLTQDEDLPGWRSQVVGSELIVTDPCEGLEYHYQNPIAGGPLSGVGLKLTSVTRGATVVRTYNYLGDDLSANLISQVDSDENQITYAYTPQGSDTLLAVECLPVSGGSRQVSVLFSSDNFLKSATWSNGGPARQYDFIINDPNPVLDGKIREVRDAADNILLHFKYDSRGRVTETNRGPGPIPEVLSRQTYITPSAPLPPADLELVDDTFMVNWCYVDATQYQATVYTFDKFRRITEKKQYHDLQMIEFTEESVPAFTGSFSLTTTIYRKDEGLGVTGGFFTIEKVLPGGGVAEYTVFDAYFNILRTFMAAPGLSTITDAINEKRFQHGQFAGTWQTTQEIDVPRDNSTTTMGYDAGSGFLISRTMPSITAGNSGSGSPIAGQTQTFAYDPVNKKRIVSETRNDGQGNTVIITNTFDNYDNPTSRAEVGACDTHTTLTAHNNVGQVIRRTDVDGFVAEMVFDEAGHQNNGSGLLLGQLAYASGQTGPLLQQTRFLYFTSGKDQGRIEKIEIADNEGSFTLGNPAAWQTTTFAYDISGRVITKTTDHTTKPGSFIWTYAYDLQDRVTQITFPDGLWIRTARDGRGHVIDEFAGFGGDPLNGTGGTTVLTSTYTYDANGNLIDRLNQTAAGQPDHSEYLYDIFNRRTEQTDRDDGTAGYDIITHFEYNNGIDVVRRYVQEGSLGPIRLDVRMEFDELGRLWRETILEDPAAGLNSTSDRIVTITYDDRGNEIETKVNDNVVGDEVTVSSYTCFDFLDSTTRVLTDTTNAVTDHTTDRRGNMTVITSPAGDRTEYDYDALSKRIESRFFQNIGGADVLQLRTQTLYTSGAQRAGQTQLDAAGDALNQQRWEYDALGFQSRRIRMADPANTAAANTSVDRVTDTTYDGLGRTLIRTIYAAGAPRTTTWGYDGISRLTSVTHPVAGNTETRSYLSNSTRLQARTTTDEIGAHVSTTVFDPFGRLISDTAEAISPAAAITTTFDYDAAGRRTRDVDPLGIVTLNGYDGIGQLTSVVEDSGGADERTVIFAYTQKGDPSTVTADDGDGPQVTTYSHDRAGRRTQVAHPSDGMTPATSTLFSYDSAGRMQSRTAEDGFVTFFEHDWRGRVITKRQADGTGPILEEFRYDPLGRMTTVSMGPAASSIYTTTKLYGNGTDVDGNTTLDPAYADTPVSVTETVNGVSKTITHAYNTAGEQSLLDYPAGCNTTLAFGYEANCGCPSGQVTSIDRNGTRLVNYEYAGEFVTSRQVRTTASPAEAWIELAWDRPDQLRRPASITNIVRTGSAGGLGGTTTDLLVFDNLFDAASNLDTQTTTNSPIEDGVSDHTYDRLHRLTQTSYLDNTSESWQLDDLSNWQSHTARDSTVTNYGDNVLNQFTSISTGAIAPQHDAKGNLVRNERGYGFTYDFENRLTRVFTDNAPENGLFDPGEIVHAEYVVDARGRRVQATIGSKTTYRFYDMGGVLLAEFDAADTANASQIYVNGPTYLDEKILTRNAAGQEAYYLLKDLYTVAAIVDEAGNILQAYAYTGYGLPTILDLGDITCTRGDVNGDGFIDVADTTAFQAVLSGADTDPVHICAADIDGDGDVDSIDEDLLLLCRFLGTCAGVCAGGDLNADGVVDLADQAVFLDVLLGYTGQTWELCAADLSRDGIINGADVKLFVNCLTNVNIACPPPLGGGVQTINNPFLFTGQRLDILDGGNLLLYDYKARVHDPLHGRFQQRDPVEFADAYNLYEYVKSRPTTLTDPSGREGTVISLAGVQAIGSGIRAIPLPGLSAALLLAKRVVIVAGVVVFVQLAVEYATQPGCNPCVPPVGTGAFRVDVVPGSTKHFPFEGTHTHHYIMMQSPVIAGCKCFWHFIGVTDLESPLPGEIPIVPARGGGPA